MKEEEEWLSDKKLRELSSKEPHLKHLSEISSWTRSSAKMLTDDINYKLVDINENIENARVSTKNELYRLGNIMERNNKTLDTIQYVLVVGFVILIGSIAYSN